MDQLTVLFLLLLGTVMLVPVADRIRIPFPVLTTMLGLALAAVPAVPGVHVRPELILPLLLPPLLYAAAQRTSWRQFTSRAQPLLLLAVALVFVSAAAVGAVAHAMIPGLPIAAALLLGAIVAPPDPAAVSAIASRLGLRRRLVTLLEGEGLFNDVTALTLYQVLVAGIVTGSLSVGAGVLRFGYSTVAAVLVGLAVGAMAKLLLDRLPTPVLRTALSLLVPYAAYVPADELKASGVLAVLTTAFFLTARADPADVYGRLHAAAFWEVVDLLATGAAFGLIGLELTNVMAALNRPILPLLGQALVICLVLVAVRAIWIPATALLRSWRPIRRLARDPDGELPLDARETLLLSWSGVRGVVTLATALALPLAIDAGTPFPLREEIVFIAFVVVLVTLVGQGLTLPWLAEKLRIRVPPDRRAEMERKVAAVAERAMDARLSAIRTDRDLPEDVLDRLARWQEMFAAGLAPDTGPPAEEAGDATSRLKLAQEVRGDLVAAARSAVLALRHQPGADPAAVDRVLRRLDLQTASARSMA